MKPILTLLPKMKLYVQYIVFGKVLPVLKNLTLNHLETLTD